MRTGAVLALAAALVLPACGGGGPRCPDEIPPSPARERPAALAARAEPGAPLVVEVTSTHPAEVPLVLRIDGEVALDVDLPAGPSAGCSGGHGVPRLVRAYDVPSGRVRVAVTVGDDPPVARPVEVPAEGTVWLVVSAEEGFTASLRTYDAEPLWG